GALTALLFALWPLTRVRRVRAAALFRDSAAPERSARRAGDIAALLGLLALLVAAALVFSGSSVLAAWFIAAIAAALAALWLLSKRVGRGAAAAARAARGRPALRLALASLGGPGGETTSAALSLGLGLAVLAAIGQVDYNMQTLIAKQLPAESPAYFFIDIQ